MEYAKTIILKDGRTCCVRNGTATDGPGVLECFVRTHAETDFLASYPDETTMTAEQEAQFLKDRTESPGEIELVAEVCGKIVGTAGISRISGREKLRHRAEFGISIDRDHWGLGIGRALASGCIECAGKAGYTQLELEVVADNSRAVALYESLGFTVYGRNPRGFRSRLTGWQTLLMMRLELDR